MMAKTVPINQTSYRPPQQMQDLQIWTVGLQGMRDGKLSEYNYTKKKAMLLSFPSILSRQTNNPDKYSDVFGIVSEEIITIDIDHSEDLPLSIANLLADHPTHFHRSRGGNGWHVYYLCPNAIPKKMRKFKTDDAEGELFQGMFVTTTDYDRSDYSETPLASITVEELTQFIPAFNNQQLETYEVTPQQQLTAVKGKYFDHEKMLREAEQILKKLPPDIDKIIEIVFETKLRDVELNSYTYWLTICQGLAHLASLIHKQVPGIEVEFAEMFHTWSSAGQSYQGRQDCDDKFYDNFKSTLNNIESVNITFDTLRRIAHNYRMPMSEFTKLKFDAKGNITGVDVTDPRNYADVVSRLELKLVQSSHETYVTGPKSVIQNYFMNERPHYLTGAEPTISIPFIMKYKNDDDLNNRLTVMFRDMGIEGCTRNHPLASGFQSEGIYKTDPLYLWMKAVPWDGTKRIEDLVARSLQIDVNKAEECEVPVEFYHKLVVKHLAHMAGLRAKSYRLMNNVPKDVDSYKKPQSVLVICGYQRKGKTTWVESLMPFQANSSISVTPSGVKDTIEMQRSLATAFVYNIDEIDVVFDKMDPSEFKSVITQEKDSFRKMYSESTESRLRASGLFGTTNSKQLRLDKTGNRRIWLIPTTNCDASPFFTCNYQQVWAELLDIAENMDADTWSINTTDERLINQTAAVYSKQSSGVKSLDSHLIGNDTLYGPDECDFRKLLDNLKQTAQREAMNKCLFTVRGRKALGYVKSTAGLLNIDINEKSFDYDILEFLQQHFGWANTTIDFLARHTYIDGVLHVHTGKMSKTKCHFIPYRAAIDELIEQGHIDADVLYDTEEK